jgi:hypothetical protein
MPYFSCSAASLAQLVARRSHNPKVVSSILTGGMLRVVAFLKPLLLTIGYLSFASGRLV